ncbi:MAG: hypothetical protein JRD94_02120 [Deltaproteobacteria bacterium]|nr:hypothetical protein [Deltaproteobacteria bacterium]
MLKSVFTARTKTPRRSLRVFSMVSQRASQDSYLFTGDSFTWDYEQSAMRAFRDYCWYSWSAQKESLTTVAEYRFNQLFSGHGPWSPWRDQDEMRVLLLDLTDRM